MARAEVWYVAYGSNLARERLTCYLEGGRPRGATVVNPGARDATPPAEDVPVDLPGRLYFAGDVDAWGGGGVAFYDPHSPGPTAARAYRVSAEQFDDIAVQENAAGRYDRTVELGSRDGLPMLTFTAPHGADAVPQTRPSAAYAAMLETGLRESRGWSEERARRYVELRAQAAR